MLMTAIDEGEGCSLNTSPMFSHIFARTSHIATASLSFIARYMWRRDEGEGYFFPFTAKTRRLAGIPKGGSHSQRHLFFKAWNIRMYQKQEVEDLNIRNAGFKAHSMNEH